MKNLSLAIILAVLSTISLSSCLQKKWDTPQNTSGVDPHVPVNSTIAQLVAMGTSNVNITTDITVAGIVAADDRSGNFYKQIVVEDSTGGITLLLAANSLYNNYPVGRKIYIKCKGLYLGNYHLLPQLGFTPDNTGALTGIPSGLFDTYVVKANFPNPVPEDVVTLSQLISNGNQYINRLVKITDVEFAQGSVQQPYAQVPTLASGTSQNIEDCNSNTIVLRTSGYANFQPFLTPSGKGTMEAIYTAYNTTPQLILRDTTDVKFNGARCGGQVLPLLTKNFDDGSATSGGWQTKNVVGTYSWSTNTKGASSANGVAYGQCSSFSGGANHACESWLISPVVDLSSTNNPSLSFINSYNYSGNPLQVLVSTDYDGTSDPGTQGTWTALSPALSTGGFTWTQSGALSLPKSKVYIAFKYTATDSAASTWEIDNITVQGN